MFDLPLFLEGHIWLLTDVMFTVINDFLFSVNTTAHDEVNCFV